MTEKRVVVIGGGIVGISTAYFLARAGVPVTVVEKGEVASGSSYGNAGLICPGHSTPLPGPGVLTQGLRWLLDARSPFYIRPRLDRDLLRWLWQFRAHCNEASVARALPLLRDMQRAGLALYREIIDREGIDCHFSPAGGLTIYRSAAAFDRARQEAAALARFDLAPAVLDGAAARAMEPAIHPDVVGALYVAEDAFLTPHLFLQAVAATATRLGADIRTQTDVIGFESDQRRVTGVRTSRGLVPAAQVVLAAGAWSAPLARRLGVTLPIQPAKGYSITVTCPEPAPRHYLYLGESRVVVTPMGARLRYAGTLELAGFDPRINQARVAAMRAAAAGYLVADGLEEQGETWRGLRPCSPDDLPYIGPTGRYPNLYIGSGHGTLGMSLGPLTGALLADLVQDRKPALPLDALAVDRFARTARRATPA